MHQDAAPGALFDQGSTHLDFPGRGALHQAAESERPGDGAGSNGASRDPGGVKRLTAGDGDLAVREMVAGLRGLHRLRRCLNGLGDLPAFVLRQDVRSGRIDWWELLRDDRRLRPYDFEFHFSVAGRRDDYHESNLAALRASGSSRISSLFGFSDLYVPLIID